MKVINKQTKKRSDHVKLKGAMMSRSWRTSEAERFLTERISAFRHPPPGMDVSPVQPPTESTGRVPQPMKTAQARLGWKRLGLSSSHQGPTAVEHGAVPCCGGLLRGGGRPQGRVEGMCDTLPHSSSLPRPLVERS
jgi:hypothetical protein